MKKNFQKTLAVIMVIAMIFTQMAIIASAAEPEIVGITAVAQDPLIEGYHGYWEFDEYWDEELEQWLYTEKYFRYNPSSANLIFTLTYEDGTEIIGTESEIYDATGYWPDVYYDQTYDNQWGVGVHESRIGIFDVEGTVQVEVIENPIESIEAVPAYDLIENWDGYYTTDYYWDEELQEDVESEEYFYYGGVYNSDFFEFTVTYKDGSIYTGNRNDIYDATNYWADVNSAQNHENPWGVGSHNVEISLLGKTIAVPVNVVECPVESITVTQKKDLIEGVHGYYTTDSLYDDDDNYLGESDRYFYYETSEAYLEYVVTYKDGTVYEGNDWDIYEQTDENINVDLEQRYDNQLEIGDNNIIISFLGFETTAQIKVVESPLDYVIINDLTLIKNADGYWTAEENWDEELRDWVRSNEYFQYRIAPDYTAVMKDGKEYKSDSDGDIWFDERWVSIEFTDDQSYENQWDIGEYEINGYLMGQEVSFTVEIIDTPIESMTITPQRDLVIGWDSIDYYYEDNDFIAEIEFKDGSTDECLVSDLYREYDYEFIFNEVEATSDYSSAGTFNFMGYDGEFEVTFIENPYESITISGANELIITFVKPDGSTETATMLDYDWRMGDVGYAYGYIITDKGKFPGGISYAYDEAAGEEYPSQDVVITIGEMESNTLEVNNWYWAFSKCEGLYWDIAAYQDFICEDYYNREFTGLNIANSDYNVTDLANISAFNIGRNYEYEFYDEEIDDMFYSYLVYDADDVVEMIEKTFNVSNIDIAEHDGYNSADNTVKIPYLGGMGDWADVNYSLEYIDGKWYGTRELYSYYSRECTYINLVLNSEMLIEKISFGKEDNNIDTSLNGWINEGGKWAFYVSGIKLTNQWKADSKGWCYLGEDGYMLTNALVKDSTGWCYVGSDGYIVYNKWVKDNGKWYFIDSKGYTISNQWKKDSTGWCYLGSDGAMLTNEWVKDSKGYCYVSATGYIVYNQWVNYDGKWYFVDANGYKVSSQWRKDSIGWCYLGSDGAMLTNEWVKDSKGYCYVGSNGYIVYNKWVSYDGKWYFVDANGYKVSSQWRKDSIGWCYLGSDGAMLTNEWVKDSIGWCYVDSSGYIVYNQWVNDDGKRYFIDANGYMVTNKWLKDGADWYYVGPNGNCLTNQWMKDSVGWCFLDENGKMVTNAMVTDSYGVCFVGENGYWQSNVIIDDGNGYLYFDETGYLAFDVLVYDGYGYRYFDETGYMVTDTWVTVDGQDFYADSNGYLNI